MSKAVVPSSIVFEVLDQHNYVEWSETIEAYLKAQDLWDVVKSHQQPPNIGEDEAQFKAWEKKNAAALHAIRISCGTNMLPYIRGIRKANAAWLRLSTRFDASPSVYKYMIFRRVPAIERRTADEENVDYELKVAYEDLDDAFSKSNLSAAIELLEKYPLLLKKTLPSDRLVVNELIKLGGHDHQQKVVEILKLVESDKSDELRRSFYGGTSFFNKSSLEVALRVEAIEIARWLVQRDTKLLSMSDDTGLSPLAAAIGPHMNEMANMLYDLTPNDFWTDGYTAMNVITKCFEVENLDFALKLLKSRPKEFILTKDFNGKSPLHAAASAPHLFRRTYHHPFLPKYTCKVLGPRLPLGSINFEISGMELLVLLGNAIRDSTDNPTKIDIVSEAFFEAIKHGNFYFILMLINSIKRIVYLTDDKSRNMYMLAIAYRHPKLFSLLFWEKQDEAKRDASLMQDKWKNNLLHMVGASTPPIALDRIPKPALQMKRELM